jgi:hypothetical protein
VRGLAGLQQAFDEVRFGGARTLNLRESRPTGAEAARRLEAWLRHHQVQQSGELLVITGRGNNSEAGIAVVRETSLACSTSSPQGRRRELRRAHARFVRRDRRTDAGDSPTPGAEASHCRCRPLPRPRLSALDESTRERLRILAERSLDVLGVRERGPFVESEMLRLFGELAAGVGDGPGREARLRPRSSACSPRWTSARRDTYEPASRALVAVLSLLLALRPAGLAAQSTTTPVQPIPGFAAANAAAQRALEDSLVRRTRADTARAHSRALSAETHVAGTPAQARTRDYVLEQTRRMGLQSEVRSYSVFMPHATSVRLWRTAPTEKELTLPRAGGRGRRDVDDLAVSDRERLQRCRRGRGRGRLRELRPDRRLCAARLTRRVRARTHRRRTLWSLVPRHQVA